MSITMSMTMTIPCLWLNGYDYAYDYEYTMPMTMTMIMGMTMTVSKTDFDHDYDYDYIYDYDYHLIIPMTMNMTIPMAMTMLMTMTIPCKTTTTKKSDSLVSFSLGHVFAWSHHSRFCCSRKVFSCSFKMASEKSFTVGSFDWKASPSPLAVLNPGTEIKSTTIIKTRDIYAPQAMGSSRTRSKHLSFFHIIKPEDIARSHWYYLGNTQIILLKFSPINYPLQARQVSEQSPS